MTQFQHAFEEFPNPTLIRDGFDTFDGLKPWFLKPVTQTILPNLVLRNDPIPGKENGKMSKIDLSVNDINLASTSNMQVFSPTHIFLHGEKMNLAVALSLITSKQKL